VFYKQYIAVVCHVFLTNNMSSNLGQQLVYTHDGKEISNNTAKYRKRGSILISLPFKMSLQSDYIDIIAFQL